MKVKRVFQIGFDIGESDKTTYQDRIALMDEINHLINNFYDINGKALDFVGVGTSDIEDMSHHYGKKEIDELNTTEL